MKSQITLLICKSVSKLKSHLKRKRKNNIYGHFHSQQNNLKQFTIWEMVYPIQDLLHMEVFEIHVVQKNEDKNQIVKGSKI
jgi:hypothetical protein